ncbi:MAG TPA: CvpA family protein [Bryobacteraceae bacterium]|nr:CvpA family protein [Bryobacteraceae bacterium]
MNWLDVVLALIVLASVIAGFRKGLSRQVMGLVSVAVALVVGIWLYGLAGSYLLPYVHSRTAANFAGFGVVFCGVMLLGSLMSFLLGKFLRVTGLSIFDHALGAGFGILRGILISTALIMGIMAFSPGQDPPASVVHSRSAPYVVDAARVAAAMAPHELRERFRKTYDQVKTAWRKASRKALPKGAGAEKTENERQI